MGGRRGVGLGWICNLAVITRNVSKRQQGVGYLLLTAEMMEGRKREKA